jgi:hypothetical protein
MAVIISVIRRQGVCKGSSMSGGCRVTMEIGVGRWVGLVWILVKSGVEV